MWRAQADGYSTLDALKNIVGGIKDDEVNLQILEAAVGTCTYSHARNKGRQRACSFTLTGPVTRSDIERSMLAGGAALICFNVSFTDAITRSFAKEEDVRVVSHKIIYRYDFTPN
jgi:translation initiation factor IF-2